MIENKNDKIQKIIIVVLVVAITIVSAILLKDMLSKKEEVKPSGGGQTIEQQPQATETPLPTPVLTQEPTPIVSTKPEEKTSQETETKPTPTAKPVKSNTTDSYNIKMIKEFNKAANKTNYLLSPYNIEIALNMLREGASGNTKTELDNLLGNRTIKDVSVSGKIGIANAIFVKDEYKSKVKKDFYTTLDKKYHSEVIYDKFTTPNKINNWVNVKTNGMIKKILNQMDKNFVMGLASALAIDVKWENSFECNNTKSYEFVKANNAKINVEMMHNTYNKNAKYFDTKEAKGVVIPYKKEDNSNVELEFVGMLPKSDVNSFINNLTNDKLNDILNNQREAGESLSITVSLPRFKYDFDAKEFIKILNNLGINDAFNSKTANFKEMIEIDENVYVGEAIHKTHIDLNELGTKAAAVTYFGNYKYSAVLPNDIEKVEVIFNKPFAYMIREKNTGEILFFGAVFEPNKWNGTTCEEAK